MKLLTSIKAWYLRVFLPFELPDHPLHYDHEAAEAAKQREEEETERQFKEIFGIDLNNSPQRQVQFRSSNTHPFPCRSLNAISSARSP